jgi:HK97 family phage major capsid protein
MPTRTELFEQKGRLVTEARAIMDTAQTAGRQVLTAEEETKFTTIHADIEALTKQIGLIDKQDEVERSLTESQGRKTDHNETQRSRLSEVTARDAHDALRAWFLNPHPEFQMPDKWRESARRVGLDLNHKSMTFRLSGNALRSDTDEGLRRYERYRDEERALSGPQSSTSVGGYAIQDAAMREVEIALLAFGGMRQVSTILRTDTGGPLPIPTVNDTTNVGAPDRGRHTTVPRTDVAFSQLVLDAYKYTSKAKSWSASN